MIRKRILGLLTVITLVAGVLNPCNIVYAESSSKNIYSVPESSGQTFDPLSDMLTTLENYDYQPADDPSDTAARLRNYDARFALLLAGAFAPTAMEGNASYIAAIDFSTETMTDAGTLNKHLSQYYKDSWAATASSLTGSSEYGFEFLASSQMVQAKPELFDAMASAVMEFYIYSSKYLDTVGQYYTDNSSLSSDHCKDLASLHNVIEFNNKVCPDATTPLFSILNYWYEKKGASGYSLSDLYAMSTDGSIVSDKSAASYNTVYTQPLTDFYTVQRTFLLDRFIKPLTAEVGGYITLGNYVTEGIAKSATYIPMQTNVYTADVLTESGEDFLNNFHYKYGFMRKALYKDTSATAAVDYYTASGTLSSNREVCTLRDILESGDKDLVLYVGTNFYNSDRAEELYNTDLSAYRDFLTEANSSLSSYLDTVSGKTTDNTDESSSFSLSQWFINNVSSLIRVATGDIDASPVEIARYKRIITHALNYTDSIEWDTFVKNTGDQYSSDIRSALSKIGTEKSDADFKPDADLNNRILTDNLDTYVLSSGKIKDYLDCVTSYSFTDYDNKDTEVQAQAYDDYTPMLSAAYVSAIYRDPYAFSISNYASGCNMPVFMASDDLCGVQGAEQYYQNTLLNYALIKNLSAMAQISYSYVFDLDAPVYIDVYGNILTENGTVVIPAACNATLFPDDYNEHAYTLGFSACYGKSYLIPGSVTGADDVLLPAFVYDEESESWLQQERILEYEDTYVNIAHPSLYNQSTKNVVSQIFGAYVAPSSTDATSVVWPCYVNIINEVMRGAPIAYIDKGTDVYYGDNAIEMGKLLAAAKLEALTDTINNGDFGNTLISIPNLATMEHLDEIIALLLKLFVVIVTAAVFFITARDVLSSAFGWKSALRVVGVIVISVIAIAGVPVLFQTSYYTANKLLLQDEAEDIVMYNLEKDESGVEVGITSTELKESNNSMMIQLDWINVPWYERFENVLFGNASGTVSQMREDAVSQSIVATQPDVQVYNDGVYLDVYDVFNSVDIDYTFMDRSEEQIDGLYLHSNDSAQTLSFYSPYYVVLQSLVANVNAYNYAKESYVYTTKYMSGNRLKTVGLCEAYFTSKDFMEYASDITRLNEIYMIDDIDNYTRQRIFDEEDIENMSKSLWYTTMMSEESIKKRVQTIDEYCRSFVADHKDMLAKVSDETFLKVMAMSVAMQYNKAFGVRVANCYEIYNIDTNDLLRLCLIDTNTAMLTSPLSFARFVYTYGGEVSIYASALLIMVMFVGGFIKPICILITYAAIMLNLIVYKLFRPQKTSTKSFLTAILLLCGTNILHAILIKLSVLIQNIGIPMIGCILVMLITQIGYLLLLAYIVGVTTYKWKDLGYSKYQEDLTRLSNKLGGKNTSDLNRNIKRHENNWEYYNDLVNQHKERGR